jgi:hypothetical protein
VKVQKNARTISFRSHSVADSGLTSVLPILLSSVISYKCLVIKYLLLVFTHIAHDIEKTNTDRFSVELDCKLQSISASREAVDEKHCGRSTAISRHNPLP